MPPDERVLVLPATHVRGVADFTGFLPAEAVDIAVLLDPAQFQFRPRSEVETDPRFLQLIPYVVLCHRGHIFNYRRGAKGTETRLHALRSLGIGGHISDADAAGTGDAYANGLARELAEEVTHAAVLQRELLGFIFDPRTPVGEVHLGVVHHFELAAAEARATEDALADARFDSLSKIVQSIEQFESWSQLTVERLKMRLPHSA